MQTINCQTIKVYTVGCIETCWGRQESRGNSQRGKYHKGTQSIPTIVWMFLFCSSLHVLSTSFLTNSTCLTILLTRFLTDKDTEIAEVLRQHSTARDMSHVHGIMSSDRGIQAVWPLRLSKGTKPLHFDPFEAGPTQQSLIWSESSVDDFFLWCLEWQPC